MDTNNQQYTMQPPTSQNHDTRVPKITFFLKLIIILLIPLIFVKILLMLPKKSQQSPSQNIPIRNTQHAQSAPPLTQATLDDWSKKLATGLETDFRSVVELPENQLPFPGVLNNLVSLAPFHFKLETFKKNADNQTGSIAVEAGAPNNRQTVVVYLRVVNGTWKIVNIDHSSL